MSYAERFGAEQLGKSTDTELDITFDGGSDFVGTGPGNCRPFFGDRSPLHTTHPASSDMPDAPSLSCANGYCALSMTLRKP